MRKPTKGMLLETAQRIHDLRHSWRDDFRETVYSEYRKGFYMVKAWKVFPEKVDEMISEAGKLGFTATAKLHPSSNKLMDIFVHIPYDRFPQRGGS